MAHVFPNRHDSVFLTSKETVRQTAVRQAANGNMEATDPPVVVFFHPDLGIGGAERLVIDAAVGLLQRGYRIVIFTNHRDPRHCFDEARDGGFFFHLLELS